MREERVEGNKVKINGGQRKRRRNDLRKEKHQSPKSSPAVSFPPTDSHVAVCIRQYQQIIIISITVLQKILGDVHNKCVYSLFTGCSGVVSSGARPTLHASFAVTWVFLHRKRRHRKRHHWKTRHCKKASLQKASLQKTSLQKASPEKKCHFKPSHRKTRHCLRPKHRTDRPETAVIKDRVGATHNL